MREPRHPIQYSLVTVFMTCVLTSCSIIAGPTVRLLTDQPELAAYVEVFNANQTEYKVEITYSGDLINDVASGETGADVIMGRGLSTPKVTDRLVSLNQIFGETGLNADSFYLALLESGRRGDEQILLPLSFNLPMVVFHTKTLNEEIPDTYFSPEAIRERASSFRESKGEFYRALGFSPLWEPAFLYYQAVLDGAGFGLTEDGTLTWDEPVLEQVVAGTREWIEELDLAKIREFDQAYMQIPEYQVLSDGRILFYITEARDFLAVPLEKRGELDFRWLGKEDRIPVLDDILHAGILKERSNGKGARAFLMWLFDPATQVSLMEVNHYKRLTGVFGIAGGLPAMREVTERELPKPNHYPRFVGHLPPAEFLLAPHSYPPDWVHVRDEIVIPWLINSATAGEAKSSLAEELRLRR